MRILRKAVVPGTLIVGVHYGWYKLQNNEDFLAPNDKRYPFTISFLLPKEKKQDENKDVKQDENKDVKQDENKDVKQR